MKNEINTVTVLTDGTITIQPKVEIVENVGKNNNLTTTTTVVNGIITQNPPPDRGEVSKEPAKKVKTYDLAQKENGFLLELFKDGRFTKVYLTSAKPGAFKGYHLHKVRSANYVCVKGSIKIILYTEKGREEHLLTADNPERLHIPPFVPTGLENTGKSEAWIINYPDPAYDPDLVGEQVEFTEEQCEAGEHKKL